MALNEIVETKKRKRKEVAIFGNYRNYYGYRVTEDMQEDPRFKVFKKEWFEGKDCLDIGCNQGLVTINIAKTFCCRSIVGIDIDSSLIETSNWNLRRISKMHSKIRQSSNASESELSNKAIGFPERSASVHDGHVSPETLFEKVAFRKENFVEKLSRHSEMYDTILCLSVTKWIHLNWGDDGLITLFANIWRLLRPDGILVLEPQPWKSYQSNRQVSEMAAWNYNNMSLYPCNFQEILLDKIGFKTAENITERLSGSAVGFDRPIFIFRK